MADEKWWNEFFEREQAHLAQPAQHESEGSPNENTDDTELRLLFSDAAPVDPGLAELMTGYAAFESIVAAGGMPPYHDANPGSPGTAECAFARYGVVLATLKEVVALCRQCDAAGSAEHFEKELNAIESMTQSESQEHGFSCELAHSLARINLFCGMFHPIQALQMGQQHLQLLVAVGTLKTASESLRAAVLAQRESQG